jgi:hypothetical protein
MKVSGPSIRVSMCHVTILISLALELQEVKRVLYNALNLLRGKMDYTCSLIIKYFSDNL